MCECVREGGGSSIPPCSPSLFNYQLLLLSASSVLRFSIEPCQGAVCLPRTVPLATAGSLAERKMENKPELPKTFKRTGDCWNKQRERHAEEIFHLLPSICSIIAPITRLIGLLILLSFYPFLPLSMCNNRRCESIALCLHGTRFLVRMQIWD